MQARVFLPALRGGLGRGQLSIQPLFRLFIHLESRPSTSSGRTDQKKETPKDGLRADGPKKYKRTNKKGADLRRPLNLFSLVDSYIFTINEALCKCRMWRPAPARSL